jgi:hypothetical protein
VAFKSRETQRLNYMRVIATRKLARQDAQAIERQRVFFEIQREVKQWNAAFAAAKQTRETRESANG